MSENVTKLTLEQTTTAMRYAYYRVRDSIEAGFVPVFGSGGLEMHFIGTLGEIIANEEFILRNVDIVTTPLRAHYDRLSATDDFVLKADGKKVQVEIKTANVLKPLDDLSSGFRFFLNVAQARRRPRLSHDGKNKIFNWDWVVCVFVNTQNLTYRIMGCVEVEHVDVYPIAGSSGGRHYEIPLEFLLPIECIWSDCSWKDR